jgi:hypothetical protein
VCPQALLSGLLYCAACGACLRASYSSRPGRRYLYYVCRNKQADPQCKQKPVAAVDLEPSLLSQLEPFLGPQPDRMVLEHSVKRVTYDSRTHAVAITLLDGSGFSYTLAIANRPGMCALSEEQASARRRVPRVSRLMALALKLETLLAQGMVRSAAELAELGHVSCARVCQILLLTNLAPAIQETVLFLPQTVSGRDFITEHRLRRIASLLDWEQQRQAFRTLLARSAR